MEDLERFEEGAPGCAVLRGGGVLSPARAGGEKGGSVVEAPSSVKFTAGKGAWNLNLQ